MQFALFVRAASHAWLDGAGAFFALIDLVSFCCAIIVSIAVSPLGPPSYSRGGFSAGGETTPCDYMKADRPPAETPL